jgi:hypothetical protein
MGKLCNWEQRMAVFAACPSCGVKLNIPDHLLGKKVRCTSCKTVFEVKAEPPAPTLPVEQSIRADLPTASLDEAPLDEAPFDEPERGIRKRKRDEDEYDDDYEDDRKRRRRMRRRDEDPHRGPLVLVLGIISCVTGVLGICCCHIIFGPVSIGLGATAFFLGHGDLRKMADGTMDSDGRGSTQGGHICGIVGMFLGIIDMMCFVGSLFLQFGPTPFNINNRW